MESHWLIINYAIDPFLFVCLWKWKRLLALNHHHETKMKGGRRGGREDIGSWEEEKEGRRDERKEGRHIFVFKVNPRNHK